MAKCRRKECHEPGRPKFCSKTCAGLVLAARLGREHYVRNGREGGKTKRAQAIRTPDYIRGYTTGWRASERWFKAKQGQLKRGRHGGKPAKVA